MSKRRINKVAVIGSGIMGSGIACHFANIGVEVLLLDIVPRELTDKEKSKGLTLEDMQVRNRLVNEALQSAIKSKPAPLYHKDFANRITTGNLEDDIAKVKDADWIIEVVYIFFELMSSKIVLATLLNVCNSSSETASCTASSNRNTTPLENSRISFPKGVR